MSDSDSRSDTKSYQSSLFVRNLAESIDSAELRELCKKYVDVKDVYIPMDYHTKKRKGFAFIELYSRKDALKLLEKINGKEVKGEKLSAMVAKQGRKSAIEMKRKDKNHKSRKGSDRDRSESRSRKKKYYRNRSRSRSKSHSKNKNRRDNSSNEKSRSKSKKQKRSRRNSRDRH